MRVRLGTLCPVMTFPFRHNLPFLTARWSNLVLITYELDPAMLQPFVPPVCELDLLDGKALASLVAFDFLDTRVMGIRWPGFVNFPEINLRFYVRHTDDVGFHRGVCFIREFVPQRTVALIARSFYNEPYFSAPMQSDTTSQNDSVTVHHTINVSGRINSIHMVGSASTISPPADSMECFVKEHEWGFGTSRSGRLIRYQVQHPVWDICPVQSFDLDWDWAAIYGPLWAPLQRMQPISTILAVGSDVKVFPRGMLKASGYSA